MQHSLLVIRKFVKFSHVFSKLHHLELRKGNFNPSFLIVQANIPCTTKALKIALRLCTEFYRRYIGKETDISNV